MIIPWRWSEVLHSLHDFGFSEALIAGGALRDLDNGKPIKDVDIFVAGDGRAESELGRLNEAFGYAGTSIFELSQERLADEYPDWNQGVCGVYNFTYEDPGATRIMPMPEFQVIVLGDTKSREAARKGDDAFRYAVVNSFDIGFCRLSYDAKKGDFGVGPAFSDAYLIDQAGKHLTVVKAPNEAQLERTKKRIERLLIKYPDFTPRCVHVSEEPVIPASMEEEPF